MHWGCGIKYANSRAGDIAMQEKQKVIDETTQADKNTTVQTEEKKLILLEGRTKKNIDETISATEKYVSRFHYTSKNVDKYIELCPHCKKPTMSAFRGSVINSAIEYLEGKRVLVDSAGQQGILTYVTFSLAIGTGLYFLLFHIFPAVGF
jgi:hypothetical protein